MQARVRAARLPLLARLGAAVLLTGAAAAAGAQTLPEVPRARTLIAQGWDFHNQVPSVDNFNPYAGVLLHQRNSLHYTVNEALFYTNHMTNELIPWLASGMAYNDGFTEVTITLRPEARWADGTPFTAADVVFSVEMLQANAPGMLFSGVMKEWVASATAPDAHTVVLKLTKPGPRFAADVLATGQAGRFVVVPKHVWEGLDAATFPNLDLAAGLPLGTGPYRLVAASPQALTYDRRDGWWAVDAGLVPAMPAVERIVYVPATAEAMPQLYASGQIDFGRSIQAGAFEAIRVQNPNLVSWNAEGPVWGAPDGCVYAVRFNTQAPPFDNADLRRAVAWAFDRDQIVGIAYEDAMPKAVVPFSSYPGMLEYVTQLDTRLGLSGLDRRDHDKLAGIMEGAGFRKGADGRWANPDGSSLQMELIAATGDPSGPVLAEQLGAAGFDVILSVQQNNARTDAFVSGNFQMDVGPHCGSLYDPWQTLEHFHSKYAAAPGARSANLRAITRYANPELDALLDQMEARQPSPADAEYMDLVAAALEIYLRDVPQVVVAEEYHVLVFNSAHWTGWPDAENPYIAPYIPWEGFARVIHNLTPRN
ncbi:MAG: ABC transporter substrate-binding protein [Rhodobacteraceae bacterium]|jgi:peptide/nickel transport system substrate-binding protein|nr:ABC transporter substrate-binding protein [Paracoccaceae bacterium]